MLFRIFLFGIAVLFMANGYSQGPLVHDYQMDDCTLDDALGNADGFVFGPNPCGCGVRSNGLGLDGNVHFGEFPQAITDLMSGDFSLSFYINIDNTGDAVVDIFSLALSCRRDSAFFIRYFPSANQLTVLLSDQPGNEVELRGDMDAQTCWNYVAFTKRGGLTRLYINNVLADEDASQTPINLVIDDNFSLANSPCLLNPSNADVRLRGRVDELRFYNRELNDREILFGDYMPDRISTSDTTIFLGESVPLFTGGTCSSNFSWSPATGLSDPNALEPIATPEISTTYMLQIEDSDCSSTDEVRINVVTSEELQCDDLMLPSAFTPNGDGINDNYGISNAFLIEDLRSFEIFNKWGGRVYYTDLINGTWDGMYKDGLAPPASYVYTVQYTCGGNNYRVTGTINLIR